MLGVTMLNVFKLSVVSPYAKGTTRMHRNKNVTTQF
jgi:hypothetical protein